MVVGVAATMPVIGVPLIAVVSATGQMISKTALFAIARWAPERLPVKARGALGRATGALEERQGALWSLVFTSAATGLPPFYGTSLASGAVGMRLSPFVAAGGLGRFVRFGALAWAGAALGA
jgi:membrane protein YqaA with SNARE-associated domain